MAKAEEHSSDLLDASLQKLSWKHKLVIEPDVPKRNGSKPTNEKGTKPEIFRTSNSALMDRVKAFLPQMEAANKETAASLKENPESCDIENTEGCSKVIEMDVSLVQDIHETALSNFLDELSSSSESDSSDESSDDDNEITISKKLENNIAKINTKHNVTN